MYESWSCILKWVCLKSELDHNAFAIYFDSFPLEEERESESRVLDKESHVCWEVGRVGMLEFQLGSYIPHFCVSHLANRGLPHFLPFPISSLHLQLFKRLSGKLFFNQPLDISTQLWKSPARNQRDNSNKISKKDAVVQTSDIINHLTDKIFVTFFFAETVDGLSWNRQ